MIRKELYIIRHGQTDNNLKGIVQGRGIDLSLNDLGLRQSQAFFNQYRAVPFDSIYTSSLTRAQETIYPFRDLGLAYQIFPELDEISWGYMEGAYSTLENSEVFLDLLAKWKAGDIDAKPNGGESPRELQERQQRFINHLLHTPHHKVLIAMHGRAIRSMLCTLLEIPLSRMEEFPHVNLCLYKVNLLDTGKWVIELFNEQAHLKGLT